MAKIADLDEEFEEWVEERPECIKEMIKKYPPNLLYRLKTANQRVTIYSYAENNTMTVTVSGDYNLIDFERNVFGIKPEDLEECDFPQDGELVGVVMTKEETKEYLKSARKNYDSLPTSH